METLHEYLQKNYAIKTAKAYGREIEAYQKNFPLAPQANYKEIVDYIGALRTRYTNAKTLNRIVCSIKAYYGFLFFNGKRKDNPARSIRLRDRQSNDIQLQDLFSTEELESLLEKRERFYSLGTRNKVLLSLLIYQALLPTELEQLNVVDINLEQGTIYIRATNKTNARELQLRPTQIMLLHGYINQIRIKLIRNKSIENLLLGSRGEMMKAEGISKHVKRIYKNRFDKRDVTSLTIRQSVITNLLKAGNDLRIVQVFAGHKKPSTTERYKQSDTELLKNAIELHHPIR
jgi:integrase/recombinase XerD